MKKFYLFVINGEPKSGKDTFIKFCKFNAYCKFNNKIKVYNFSTIDSVKNAAKILGWNGRKEEKDRKFLSELKKLWIKYYNGPLNELKNEIVKIHYNNQEDDYLEKILIFVHCRESEEIKKIDENVKNGLLVNLIYKYKKILIKRKNLLQFNNKSDLEIDKYNKYDLEIDNNDTLQKLQFKSLNFLINL